MTARLEDLVARARSLVYEAVGERRTVSAFFARDYWVSVLERPVLLLLAAAFLFAPMVASALWALSDPAAAVGVVPEQLRGAGRTAGGDLGIPVGLQAALATAIFTNNIRVALLAFAGGIAAGLGTVAALLYNGVFIGAVMGVTVHAGAGGALYELIVAHGVLELSCIVVAGAAGMRMGWALIEPGNQRTRGEALVQEARVAIEIALGTVPWLVVAGLVEGFVTPAGIGAGANSVIGFGLGTLFWGFALWRGRPSEPGARLGA